MGKLIDVDLLAHIEHCLSVIGLLYQHLTTYLIALTFAIRHLPNNRTYDSVRAGIYLCRILLSECKYGIDANLILIPGLILKYQLQKKQPALLQYRR